MANLREYVIFRLENEYYGLDIQIVENIEKMPSITRVPYTNPYISGIINLRGNVIPIINLRKRFNLSEFKADDNSRIIIVNEGEITVGLLVDASSETLQLNESQIDASPSLNSRIEEAYVKEIGKHDNRIIMLLDIKRVLGLIEEEQVK